MNKDKEISFRTVPLAIQFNEEIEVENVPTKVQLMRTGTFFDKRYGKVEITKNHFENMIKKFGEQVRGIELMIDYKHDSDAEAAGWIKELEILEVQLSEADLENGIEERKGHELWAVVDWTPTGRKKLSDKEFAYLSADFDPDYRDNENPEVSHGIVLLGAALTNRPVIKRMNPAIQLSEIENQNVNKENEKMDDEKKELEEKELQEDPRLAKLDALMKDLGVESIEDLMKMISELRSQNEEMTEEKMLSEKNAKLDGLMKDGKITAAQKEAAIKLSENEFNGFVSMAEMNEQVIKLDESGNNETPKGDENRDVQDQVIELAEKKMNEDKISFTEATALVLLENKELAEKYNNL